MRVIDLAIEHRLATMAMSKEFVEQGGLASYGADITPLFVVQRSSGQIPQLSPGPAQRAVWNRRHSSGTPLADVFPDLRTSGRSLRRGHELFATRALLRGLRARPHGAAPMWTAIPARSSPMISHSPVWMPQRTLSPREHYIIERVGTTDCPSRCPRMQQEAHLRRD